MTISVCMKKLEYEAFFVFVFSIMGFAALIKLLQIYSDIAWEYGIYWFTYIIITPGLRIMISFICSILSSNSVINKFVSIIGKVIGGNTLAIFLADTIGPFFRAAIGNNWDTEENYIMSKLCIIPLSFIFAGFGYFFDCKVLNTNKKILHKKNISIII